MSANILNVGRKKANAAKNRLENVMEKKESILVIVRKSNRKGAFKFENIGSQKS
jgi:hypothetical protein